MKTCIKCGEEKPRDKFYRGPRYKDGLFSSCKVCTELAKKGRPSVTTEHRRAYNNKRKFGITPEYFDSLLDQQENTCAICGRELSLKRHGFAVDHNHVTGEVRGILCSPCNTGIGQFRDNPSIIHAAAGYLEQRGHYG